MSTEPATLLQRVLSDAERALGIAWAGRADLLALDPGEAVRPRSTVARCLVRTDAADAPATVIVKSTRGRLSSEYDPTDTSPQASAGRLLNDWSGCAFLSKLTTDPLCPRVYAGDRETGVIVIEDLGDGASLSTLLVGTDSDAAALALEAYARGLGRMHATTSRHAENFLVVRANLGLASPVHDRFVQMWPPQTLPKLGQLCSLVDVAWTEAAADELNTVIAAIAEPGPFDALSQGDTCPDNHRLLGDAVRFLDFEFCGFRHALLDLAFIWVPFPTCQDVRRVPREIALRAQAAYRAEFSVDDAEFAMGVLHARAWWTMLSLGPYLSRALDADQQIGTATIRQRLLLWLESFAADADALPALQAVTLQLHRALAQRWRCEDLPVYPAFSRAPDSSTAPAGSS